MIAKTPYHLIPALLVVASTLTLSACSESGTSTSQPVEQSNALLDRAEQATSEIKGATTESAQTAADATSTAAAEIKAASNSAVESASSTVQETVASASSAATETVKAVGDKATTLAGSAKTSVTESSSKAVNTVTEKAADAKTALSSKAAALTTAASSGSSQAEMLALAKESGCLVCHAVDKKIVGPAWRDVAAKYRGQSDAKSNLITSITQGSSGKWGMMAMPANSPRVTDDKIATLAGFILSLE